MRDSLWNAYLQVYNQQWRFKKNKSKENIYKINKRFLLN